MDYIRYERTRINIMCKTALPSYSTFFILMDWKENWCPYITYMSNYFCDAPWWEWWWMMITVTVGTDDLLCSPVIDLQHQRVYWRQDQSQMSAHSMCEQQRAREVRGRTRAGWRGRGEQLKPPTDHTTVDRQDTILKITASLQWIQIISDRLNTANVLMPKLACTQVKLVCSLEISDSPHRGFSRGRMWTQPWPEDSRHSTVTYVQKSLWEVFCQIKSLLEFSSVLLWQQLVLEELHDRVNNTHVTVDLVNTDP